MRVKSWHCDEGRNMPASFKCFQMSLFLFFIFGSYVSVSYMCFHMLQIVATSNNSNHHNDELSYNLIK